MNNIKFSVVIPLFNKVDSIERTLTSITNQRLAPSEIIVIDDGSTDGSAEKVESLGIPNLTLVRQSNQGVSVARNNGVSLAKHKYVAFIDADDQWSVFFLYEMNKLIQRFPNHECFASAYQKVLEGECFKDPKIVMSEVSAQGDVMNDYFAVCAEGDLPFMPSSLIMTIDLFESVGGFPAGEAMGEDQALFSNIALQTGIVYSPLVLMLYHTDSENRACERHLPKDLLPFAKRLMIQAVEGKRSEKSKRDMIKYCAAHACYLVKLNLKAGNLQAAKHILNYSICQLKPSHYQVFKCWYWLKVIMTYIPRLNAQSIHSNSQ
ncbi:glycosyltransferase family 2 protein [Paraglaciecola sp.]|uniref:glycosyltransferase family 2 protein n=1 Tax=Paraglaciecola sp. TaxID=1920173 RepID=UPI003EF81C9B